MHSATAWDLALTTTPPVVVFAEAQRLERGPRLQGAGLVGRRPLHHPPTPEVSLLEAQQELGGTFW